MGVFVIDVSNSRTLQLIKVLPLNVLSITSLLCTHDQMYTITYADLLRLSCFYMFSTVVVFACESV